MAAILAAAVAMGGDFDPSSKAWNGTGYLETTAREARVIVTLAPDELDWSTVDREESLLLLAPGPQTDIAALRTFVSDGGHLVVALDRGSDPALAEAFGLRLLSEPVIHDDYFEDHPGFPRISPPAEDGVKPHFLWYNVNSVVLNHPTALAIADSVGRRAPAHVLIPFAEPDQAFAIEVQLGDGYALFVADASIFINEMQRQAYGDKQFVANVLRYYCEDLCATLAVGPNAVHRGTYRPATGTGFGGLGRVLKLAVDEINELVAGLGKHLGAEEMLFALSVSLLGILLFGSGLLPWPRAVQPFEWQNGPTGRPSDVAYQARALARARDRADFSAPARALMERYEDETRGRVLDSPAATRCAGKFQLLRPTATPDAAAGQNRARPESRIDFHAFESLKSDCAHVLANLEQE
jgi:hypothetical protein